MDTLKYFEEIGEVGRWFALISMAYTSVSIGEWLYVKFSKFILRKSDNEKE